MSKRISSAFVILAAFSLVLVSSRASADEPEVESTITNYKGGGQTIYYGDPTKVNAPGVAAGAPAAAPSAPRVTELTTTEKWSDGTIKTTTRTGTDINAEDASLAGAERLRNNIENDLAEGAKQRIPQDIDQTAIMSCERAQKSAQAACASFSLLGMDPGTAAMMEGLLTQSMQMIAAQKQQGSAAQCKSGQDLSKMMNIITMAKTGACMAMMSSCNKSCAASIKQYNQLSLAALDAHAPPLPTDVQRAQDIRRNYVGGSTTAIGKCESYKGNLAQMMAQSVMNTLAMTMKAKCQDNLATASTPPVIASAPPFVVPTPGGDCSDPKTASLNIACICQSNPKDKLCGAGNAANVFGGGGSTVGGGGPGTPTGGSAGADFGSDGEEIGAGGVGSKERGVAKEGDGGGGGGLGGGGGGGLNGMGDDGGGGGPSGVDKNVITGQSSGNGGGGGGGFAPTSGGGGGGKGGGSGDGSAGGGGGFNLSKYLPKDAYKARGLAGMSIEAKDGVTGPMGPSIWEKVSNQYQNQKSSLYQDR